MPSDCLPRLIAFYLPQFHPIPENDAWWGRGFTEWSNVTKARPSFPGHYQPHLPADLGFYDLRLPEAREAQATLAREYGIYGFCYYHYWFHGRRLLERPFHDVLELKQPDFPFCLCWANESWSRRWDGGEKDILITQSYSPEDDLKHIRYLLAVFGDARYIRIDGKPLFLVYRGSGLRDPLKTTSMWREEATAQRLGELYLCCVETNSSKHFDPRTMGFDASVEFQPDWSLLGARILPSRWQRFLSRLQGSVHGYDRVQVFDYPNLVERMMRKPEPSYRRYPGVTPSWDNTARRAENGLLLKDSSPELYRYWLASCVTRCSSWPPDERIVFINAWNEWAEGNHLEPDQRYGRAYLEATRNALKEVT